MACHCVGCQKMTASAFSLSAAIPTQGFRVTSGEPVIGGLHGTERHYFCPFCLSWLFTKPAGIDVFVNVRSTLLMEPASAEPFIETFTSEMLNWASTPARHSYAGFPPPDSFDRQRSEAPTSQLQSLLRISSAVSLLTA